MEIKKIYFDMDGVLADFDRGVIELAGGTLPYDQHGQPVQIGDAEWLMIREVSHFYDRLEYMPGGRELFDTIYSEYGDRCEILSGIPKPHRGITTAKEDKISWVRRMLSEDIRINIVYKEEKPQYCGGRDCILIDDYLGNILSWEAMGGMGIMHTSAEDTLRRLKELELL